MKKKVIIIIVIVLALIGVGVYFVLDMFEGARESTIEKVKVEDTGAKLGDVPGVFKGNSKDGSVELLFSVEGMKDTKGAFEELTMEFDVKKEFQKSSLTVDIASSSLNTENEMRDEHLQAEDYFNVAAHPQIKFVANEFTVDGKTYTAKGNLTFMGQTNPIDVPFEYEGSVKDNNKSLQVFKGEFQFDRTKYGMEEEQGIGNVVTLTFYAKLSQ